MLSITIPALEAWDEANQRFVNFEETKLDLEHSLVSLSKWESKWEKPFLAPEDKSQEETLSYVECMILTPNFPPEVLSRLTNGNIQAINEYIEAKMTATWFAETKAPARREIITAEVIYYWMVALTIPFETEVWHLNRLLTLIKVCNAKNQPEKKGQKPTQSSLAARRALNEQRKAQLGTTG
jgi:hypothetical protein